jgi:flagellar biosynthesis anti-sigma factor FlgM
MKIQRTKPVEGVERTPSPTEGQGQAPAPKAPTDRVSVGAEKQVGELLQATRGRASAVRTARLEQIAAAIKQGQYRPDASRIADQILTAAEVDARLRALLQKG